MEQHKPVANLEKKKEAFARALGVMQTLRSDCPWDAKQNNESIRQNTIEETYELAEALIKGDAKEIQKECGDVLEQIFFYSMFAEEKGSSTWVISVMPCATNSSSVILMYSIQMDL